MFAEYQEKLQSGASSQIPGHEMNVIDPKLPSSYGAVEQNNGFQIAEEETNGTIVAVLPPSPEKPIVVENGKSKYLFFLHYI